MSPPNVAQQALDLAREAKGDIDTHEAVCAERYAGIRGDIKRLTGYFAWSGGTLALIIIGVIGFLTVRLLDANDAAIRSQQTRTESLQQIVAELRRDHKQ